MGKENIEHVVFLNGKRITAFDTIDEAVEVAISKTRETGLEHSVFSFKKED